MENFSTAGTGRFQQIRSPCSLPVRMHQAPDNSAGASKVYSCRPSSSSSLLKSLLIKAMKPTKGLQHRQRPSIPKYPCTVETTYIIARLRIGIREFPTAAMAQLLRRQLSHWTFRLNKYLEGLGWTHKNIEWGIMCRHKNALCWVCQELK